MKNIRTKQQDYLSVNNIRFMSMVGIVLIHGGILSSRDVVGMVSHDPIELILTNLAKFGTLCFFMISGYLLGDKLSEYNPVVFLQKRTQIIGIPWFFWSLLTFNLIIYTDLYRHKNDDVFKIIGEVIFGTEYWFVPNFLLCLAILVLYRKWLDNIWLGVVFLCMTLFYAVNLYGQWIPSSHTTALLGFVFWLWLGYQFQQSKIKSIQFIKNLKTPMVLLIAILGFSLNCLESIYLSNHVPNADPFNTLRLSNMLYGITIYILLGRLNHPIYPRFINPRTDTFGIYLSHGVFLMLYSYVFIRLFSRYMGVSVENFKHTTVYLSSISPFQRLSLWIFSFLLIYGVALCITKLVGHSRFHRLVGLANPIVQKKISD